MSRLYFECRFKAYKLLSLDLPIEIREYDLTLVARCRSSQSVELEAGTYYLTARLPTGKKLKGKVQLTEGADILVILTSEEEDETASEVQEMFLFLGELQDTILRMGQPESSDSRSNAVTSLLGTLREALLSFRNRTNQSERVTAKLRLFRGNALQGNCGIAPTDDWMSPLEDGQPVIRRSGRLRETRWLRKSTADEDLRVARLYVSGVNSPQMIQLLQPQMQAINVMIPASIYYKCSLVLKQFPNGSCSVDIHLANTEANLLLRYLQEGLLTQGAVLAASEQQVLEALLNLKLDDPIAAAVGAYALLRVDDLERLNGWTEELNSRFAWLPDGIAIRGEYLARIGEHDQALTLFLDLPSRGLPIFSDGLSYVIDQLRRYTRRGEDYFDHEKLSQAQALLKQLQRIASFVDFRQSLLTFTGLDPCELEDDILGIDISSYEGLDVATLLHPPRSKHRSLIALIRNIRIQKVVASLWAYFKTYGASLVGIGVMLPFITTLITVVLYLLPPLSILPLFTRNWYAFLSGIFFSSIVWGVLATRYIAFVTPMKANAHSYSALKDRLHRLKNRLGISEQEENSTIEEMLRAARIDPDEKYNISTLSALKETYASYFQVSKEINKSSTDLRWMLGTGYIKAWKVLHRAEEALVQFDPIAPVIRGTIHTKVRIQNSNIGNRADLLHLSKHIVNDLGTPVRISKSTMNVAESGESVTSDNSVIRRQIIPRIASRFVRQVFNEYRDNLWQKLIRSRNQLLGLIVIIGLVTYILLCTAIFISNPITIVEATAYYTAGSIAGLIRPLYKTLKRSSIVDDYGFSWIYALASYLFSGLTAVVGLLVIGQLPVLYEPSIGSLDIWLNIFRSGQLLNLLIAMILGLLSNFYFRKLVKQVEKIDADLLRSKDPSPHNVTLPIT